MEAHLIPLQLQRWTPKQKRVIKRRNNISPPTRKMTSSSSSSSSNPATTTAPTNQITPSPSLRLGGGGGSGGISPKHNMFARGLWKKELGCLIMVSALECTVTLLRRSGVMRTLQFTTSYLDHCRRKINNFSVAAQYKLTIPNNFFLSPKQNQFLQVTVW